MKEAPATGSGKDGSVTIYLARHGRTELNAAGLLRGHLDPELDSVGEREAHALAQALAKFSPGLIVSSPLRRAVATARCVARECDLDLEIDEQLIDRDYGPWAGQSPEEVSAQFGNIDAAPGVELSDDVTNRALAALNGVADRSDQSAVIVAHDAVNRLLISALEPQRYRVAELIPQG